MDILRLLEDLKRQIEETPSLGPITWGLDRDEIGMQIAKIRATLPVEVKAAASTVRESERIIDTAREDAGMALENARKEASSIVKDAKAEAERILEQARLQQEQMLADSEILKLSKAQAEEIRSSADRDAVLTRRGAEDYTFAVLTQLEGVVSKVATTIERGKQEMKRPEPGNPPIGREKLRQ